jgi:hypothetical protein
MFFLLRVAFWLSIVVMLLPAGPKTDPHAAEVSTFEALGAAQAAWNDARGFCERQPGACVVGSQALQVFGQKAQNGARMLYEWLASSKGDAKPDAPTGSVEIPGRNTLTERDLEPLWLKPDTAPPPMPARRPA